MDFNDIQNRLERLYISINNRFDTDVGKYTKVTVTNTPSSYSFSVNFGGDKVANQEKIMSIIHNIANLRDHLKNNIAEAEVKKYFYSDINLKIIMDLSNADKHGYPTRDNNSKLNPKIENIISAVQLQGTMMTFALDGTPLYQGNPPKIVIMADIMDDSGNRICTIDELIEKSMLSWETFMKKHNLI